MMGVAKRVAPGFFSRLPGRPGIARRGRVGGLIAVTLILLCSACGGDGEAGKSGSEILADSVRAFHDAPSFRVSGQLTLAGHAYALSLAVLRGHGVAGVVTTGGTAVSVLQVGTRTFLSGRAYLATVANPGVAKLAGDSWVLYPSTDLESALAEFASPNGLWSGLAAQQASVNKDDQTTVNGVDVIKLSGGNATFYVATRGKPYPIRAEGSGITSSGGAVTQYVLNFADYGKPFDIAGPAHFLDFSQPSTLPPILVVTSGSVGPLCGNYGCTLIAVIRNDGGAGGGRVLLHLRTPGGDELAHCSAPVHPLAYGTSRQVACWAYSRAFQDYVASYSIARLVVVPEIV